MLAGPQSDWLRWNEKMHEWQVGDPGIFSPNDTIIVREMIYRVIAVDRRERVLTIENIRQSRLNWQNLSRSSQPRRVGVT